MRHSWARVATDGQAQPRSVLWLSARIIKRSFSRWLRRSPFGADVKDFAYPEAM